VPSSSPGFADDFSSISPRECLGCWQLIEQSDAVVRYVHRADRALPTSRKWVQFWEAR